MKDEHEEPTKCCECGRVDEGITASTDQVYCTFKKGPACTDVCRDDRALCDGELCALFSSNGTVGRAIPGTEKEAKYGKAV